jgi:hypothetical protein
MALDYTTPVAQVRALIPDIELIPNPNRPGDAPEYMLSDEHITALLAQSRGSVIRATAWACDLLGRSEGIIAKVITTEDLSTDGAKMMNAFGAQATRLFAMADREDADASEDSIIIVNFELHGHCEPR